MEKIGKIAVFFIILTIGVGGIIYNKGLNINDDVYVVSKAEETKKDTSKEDTIIKETSYNFNNDNIKKKITIFISGEVKNPGVVTIESDKRLSDAVDMIGGTTENADLNKVNLAIKIKDEQHYIIPKIGENITDSTNQELVSNQAVNDKININIATIEELDKLPGVGEATANKIINYREENGNFKSIEEIKNVNGIGDKKYKDLKDKISVE